MSHPGMTENEIKAEKIARRMAKDRYGSEGLWEMFLLDAYQEAFPIPEPECNCDVGERPWRDCELHDPENTTP